jgi:1-aminocyclopropane-1-carboxylate deaminase
VFPVLPNIPIQEIKNNFLEKNKVQLDVQREDLIHPEVSGNKWRKLKYNVNEYFTQECQTIVTFGGAFSNHIAATASIGKILNIPTHGIIRGEEVVNSTLQAAVKNGMKLYFTSREEYKKKQKSQFVMSLLDRLKNPYVIPEGGSNLPGLKGCQEIIQDLDFDIVICACGTGSTLSGIISSLQVNQHAIGVSVLKGGAFLEKEINKNLLLLRSDNRNWKLETNFHLGGYAKYNFDLFQFINSFWKEYSIKLDPIYTGKAMFGLYKLIESGELKAKKIRFIHTGGLQGIQGFENRYNLKLFQK